jgi:hypothetical protein
MTDAKVYQMTDTIVTEKKPKRIEDLTLREFDMAYSLSRTGWSCRDIGRRYEISETDARTVVDNYEELRRLCERKPPEESPNRNLGPEPVKQKPRKRRSDAIYATAKDRQAAYRARLQESRRARIEQPSRTTNTDTPIPAVEEPSVTTCEARVIESSPENAETQHSPCYGSSEECSDISESASLSVTPQICSESEKLRLIEE